MPIETPVTGIWDLDPTNPTAGDPRAEGDDHIRLTKSAVLLTFPNITAIITADHVELNLLDGATITTDDLNLLTGLEAFGVTTTELQFINGVTSNIQDQLNGKAASSHNHNASDITAGTLVVSRGGTGLGTIPNGAVMVGSVTGAVTPVAPVATGRVFTDNGPGIDPSFQVPEVVADDFIGTAISFNTVGGVGTFQVDTGFGASGFTYYLSGIRRNDGSDPATNGIDIRTRNSVDTEDHLSINPTGLAARPAAPGSGIINGTALTGVGGTIGWTAVFGAIKAI